MDKRVEAIEFTMLYEPFDCSTSDPLAIAIPAKRNITRHSWVPQCRKLMNEKMKMSFSAPVNSLAFI
jgi:hypothetical protein